MYALKQGQRFGLILFCGVLPVTGACAYSYLIFDAMVRGSPGGEDIENWILIAHFVAMLLAGFWFRRLIWLLLKSGVDGRVHHELIITYGGTVVRKWFDIPDPLNPES